MCVFPDFSLGSCGKAGLGVCGGSCRPPGQRSRDPSAPLSPLSIAPGPRLCSPITSLEDTLLTPRAPCAREMMSRAQTRCLCSFRSLPGLWVQRTIAPFSVALSPRSAWPSWVSWAGACGRRAGGRDTAPLLAVGVVSIQQKRPEPQISGTSWSRSQGAWPSGTRGCPEPRQLGKEWAGLRGRVARGQGAGPAAAAAPWGSPLGCKSPNTESGASQQRWPLRWVARDRAAQSRWRGLQKCIPPQRWEAILSDPEAGTLRCSAYLPGTRKSFLSECQAPSPGARLSHQADRPASQVWLP